MAAPKKNITQQLKSDLAASKVFRAKLEEQLEQLNRCHTKLKHENETLERDLRLAERNAEHINKIAKNLDQQINQAHEILSALDVPKYIQKTGEDNIRMSLLQRLSVFLTKR
jgi:septation ring formation regulator EzrA